VPAKSGLSTTDRALVAALAAWGGVEALPSLRRFGAQRARGLAGALVPEPPPEPLEWLRRAHAAQLAPDPARVHPSWFVRALQEESPAVRRIVLGATPEPLRSDLIRGVGLNPSDLAPDGPVDPEARDVALALWTERLVGDLPPDENDPPVIRALTTLGPFALYRLFRLCGLAKRSIIPGASILASRPRMAARFDAFRARLAGPFDPRLVQLAANEWASTESFGRHRLAGYGLATPGRLLAGADPYRARWALQHVPYPVAKRLRGAASRTESSVRAVIKMERQVLDAAHDRLREEGAA
jgi:hypothetical protein